MLKTYTLPVAIPLLFATAALPLRAQNTVQDSILHDGLTRQYQLHLPPAYNGTDSLPLVVMLHGGSGSAQTVQGFTQFNPVANNNGFMILYPEGYAPTGIGGFSWADGRGTTADQQGIDDVDFVHTLLDSLELSYAIDTMRIYLAGFSNGGFLVQRIACERNEGFAVMGSLGCTQSVALNDTCNPGRPIPTITVHGTADSAVPYFGGIMPSSGTDVIAAMDLVEFWKGVNGCSSTLDSLNVPNTDTTDNSIVRLYDYTDCDCNADVRHLRCIGAGHTWPGVEIPALEVTAGETNEDIVASAQLWNFFNQYSLCDTLLTHRPTAPAQQRTRLQLFPNPTTGELHFRRPTGWQGPLQVTVYDANGRRVLSQGLDAGRNLQHLQLQHLPKGMYVLRLQGGTQQAQERFLLR